MFVDRPRPIAHGTLVRGDAETDNAIRGQRGLGRDLAAILDSSFDQDAPTVGLTQLLGERRPSSPSVRRFVVDVALAAIAEAFEADAIVLARRRHDDDAPIVSTRLPPSWGDESGVKFELTGHVWRVLNERASWPHRAATIDGLHAWIGGHRGESVRLAVAVARRKPLTDREEIALGRVVRSIACAVDDSPAPLPNGARLLVSFNSVVLDEATADADGRSDPTGTRAVVALRGGGERRTAAAEAADADLAVAKAAVELADAAEPLSVTFAGRASVEDVSVSIVVLERPDDAPLLGLVVSEAGSRAGPAEAVFAALGA